MLSLVDAVSPMMSSHHQASCISYPKSSAANQGYDDARNRDDVVDDAQNPSWLTNDVNDAKNSSATYQ